MYKTTIYAFALIQNSACTMKVLLSICALFLISKILQLGECSMQAAFHRSKGKYLANHVIATKQATSESECGIYCIRDGSCLSANYKTSGVGKGRCELNNKIIQDISEADQETKPEYNYLYVIKEVGYLQLALFSLSCFFLRLVLLGENCVTTC